jgi:hypothetical protein
MPRGPSERVSNKPMRRAGQGAESLRNAYDYQTFRYTQNPPKEGDLPQYPMLWQPDKGDHEYAKRQKIINEIYPKREVVQTIDEKDIRMAEKKMSEMEGLAVRDFIHQNVDWSNGLEVQHMAEKGLLDRFERQDALRNNVIDFSNILYKAKKYGKMALDMDEWVLLHGIASGAIQVPPLVLDLINPEKFKINYKGDGEKFEKGLLNPFRYGKFTTYKTVGEDILKQLGMKTPQTQEAGRFAVNPPKMLDVPYPGTGAVPAGK